MGRRTASGVGAEENHSGSKFFILLATNGIAGNLSKSSDHCKWSEHSSYLSESLLPHSRQPGRFRNWRVGLMIFSN